MLYYNFNQCTGGSRQEFYELTLGEVNDMIVTFINVNNKNKKTNNNKKNDEKITKGQKETYYRIEEFWEGCEYNICLTQ